MRRGSGCLRAQPPDTIAARPPPQSRIFVKDIGRDFKAMNAVWNDWVDSESKGCRFCVEAPMAREALLVEIQVMAAVDEQWNRAGVADEN